VTTFPRPHFAETDFKKAAASNPRQECVRVARRDGWAELRDDKAAFGGPDDHRIALTSTEFDAFQDGLRAGTDVLPLQLDQGEYGTYTLRHPANPTVALTFTEAEINAFVAGIQAREFDLAT
jgi:hypothetical protein